MIVLPEYEEETFENLLLMFRIILLLWRHMYTPAHARQNFSKHYDIGQKMDNLRTQTGHALFHHFSRAVIFTLFNRKKY